MLVQVRVLADREDLVDVAQKCYDEEVSRRGLDVRTGKARVAREHVISSQSDALGDDEEAVDEESVDDAAEAGDQPGWLEEAACVLSYNVHPGQHLAPECENARDVLQAAGIPCYLELHEIEQSSAPEPTHDWRVLVPGKLNLRATSVLEEEIGDQVLLGDLHLEGGAIQLLSRRQGNSDVERALLHIQISR